MLGSTQSAGTTTTPCGACLILSLKEVGLRNRRVALALDSKVTLQVAAEIQMMKD